MNLAEIRRKAQATELPAAVSQVAAPQAAAPAQAAAPTAASAPAAPAQAAPAQAEPAQVAPAQVAPAQAAPAQAAAPQAAPVQLAPALTAEAPQWEAPSDWQPVLVPARVDQANLTCDPGDADAWEEPQGLVPVQQWEEPSGFDPAALILRGRQTAASLEEVAREVDKTEESLELLCFRVATEDYAISIMDIKEIIKPREVTEVPRVPAFVRGILSLRGIIIPVFDMRLRLGLPEGVHSERERIIVVKRQGGFCGVLVDQVVQVVRIDETKLEAPPVVLEGIDREFILGIGRVAERMLILLDMEKVLDIGLL